jgi:hypothetical protein
MNEEKSFGIVIVGLGSDDLAVTFVDEVRWAQVSEVEKAEIGTFDDMREWINYLSNENEDNDVRPEGCPERQGAVLKTVFCQSFVTELVSEVRGRILGIMFSVA